MNASPAISVIMPAYKASATIEASVASVRAQTLRNWELIIVDDGSPDDTAAVAKSLAAKDSRIRVISRENSGPSIARNRAVDHAKADVLAFLDADDFWAPERCLGMLTELDERPNTGVLFSRTRFIDAKTLKLGTFTPHYARLSAAQIMAENVVCSTSNIVCRREVFKQSGGFTAGLNYAEDQDWLLRIALESDWDIRGVDAEWFFYRSAEDSQSADLEAMRAGWIQMVGSACIDYPEKAPRAVRKAYGPSHRQLARRALRMSRPNAALRYLTSALRHDPLLIIREPRRTILTLVGALVSFIPSTTLKELVAK